MKHSPLLIVVLLAVIGCKPTVPSQYIQPDELEDILYDYHVAEAMARSQYGNEVDVRRNAFFQSMLCKHGVTEAEFDSSLVYYYSHVNRLQEIYERVNGRLTGEAERLGTMVGDINRYSQYGGSGDTANIWRGPDHLLLIPKQALNRFDFTVKADTTFRQGDSFMFQFQPQYIWQSGGKDAVICMRAAYENDSIVQVSTHVSSTSIAQLRLSSPDDSTKLRDLRGFIYLSDAGEDLLSRKMMFVSQIQLIRFHKPQPVSHDATTEDKDTTKNSLQPVEESRGIPVPATGHRIVGRTSDGSAPPDD